MGRDHDVFLHRHRTFLNFTSPRSLAQYSTDRLEQAKNIVNYLRVIHRILAPGGVWINLGPLLWHFENNNSHDPSVELDLEEVKRLAELVGFEINVRFFFFLSFSITSTCS